MIELKELEIEVLCTVMNPNILNTQSARILEREDTFKETKKFGFSLGLILFNK